MEKGLEEYAKNLGTRIFLVRHGETDWNQTGRFQGRIDTTLNQKGKNQALALALTLKDEPILTIYSSPLVRAMETARCIKEFHPLVPLLEEEGLTEMDLGEFDGMEADHWVAQYQDFIKTWRNAPSSLRMPGGESLQEVQNRAIHTLEHITNLHPPKSTLLLCSHNFVNRSILCYVSGIPLDRFRDVRQDLAALNLLCKNEGRWHAEVINEVSHLEKI